MSNVRDFSRLRGDETSDTKRRSGDLSGHGEPPDNGGMEARMAKLEELVKGLPTKSEFGEFRAELRADHAVLRADVAKGQVDMHKAIADNHRWTHGALIGFATLALAGIVGVMVAIWNIGKPAAPVAPPAAAVATQPNPYLFTIPQTPAAPTPKP